ncbi:hypothetical protein [Maribacter sp. HTCC2170]|uniref:hypothetical protein n=1 Tax=Maribacter sp. (strain HTCC2170 / KCCM 42371) TaxID=313603 RepID=UPI00006B2204|nr:hypothetical protein [Maribacter sp. HTCC2170]EAR00326.1 hypothetical protein FB2170_12931 [Maribacter sp. HTCC2170]
MDKNYLATVLHFFFTLAFVGTVNFVQSQEIKIFTLDDFDLKGPVESCLVSTKYGKETYEFNEEGLLTKSVTRYNDEDYDVTYYKYVKGELIEKRFENYRNSIFDRSTSYANFYEIDTIPVRKVTEKIITYEKEFLDRYEYLYNADGILVKIIRTNNDGNDETLIEYTDYKGEQTQTNSLNGTVLKSVRKSTKIGKNKKKQQITLTKKFLEGEPLSALEAIYNEDGKLVLETKFEQDPKKNQFAPHEIITYEYDEKGMLVKAESKSGNTVDVKEYIYQFDNGEEGNWIKEIITPANTYTTRKISYYEVEEDGKDEE